MSDEQLDRFARGELSPAESRALARRALDNPELFEELTATAIAKTELANRTRRRSVRPIYAILATAAAVVAAISLYAFRPRPAPAPATAMVFLPRAVDARAVFRGEDAESRAPRAVGAVSSIDGTIIGIDLGSLDGLAKGDEVQVVRGGKPVGAIKLTTVFREHARAEAPAGLAIHDEVRVPPAAQLRAALDQIAAFMARGDAQAARRIAEQAAANGTLDIDAGSYEDLNNLAGIAALHGDKAKAISLYSRALAANPPPDARGVIARNLSGMQGPH